MESHSRKKEDVREITRRKFGNRYPSLYSRKKERAMLDVSLLQPCLWSEAFESYESY